MQSPQTPDDRNTGDSLAGQSEDPSLELITPVSDEKLASWLAEFYGKPVEISRREVLRHRDLSRVERLQFKDALPESLIYKQVLPPWEIEQDLHERILIPSISNSPQLYMSAHSGQTTVMFLEDLGPDNLLECCRNLGHDSLKQIAAKLGEELAKMHRAYSYRTEELGQLGILRTLTPADYAGLAASMADKLAQWRVGADDDLQDMSRLAEVLGQALAAESVSLTHGDFYAENIVLRGGRLFIIDWSWFAMLGVPLMDIATITMAHHKNGNFVEQRRVLLETYCFESGRAEADVEQALPYAEALSRLLFLEWLVERKSRGIEGTTVGPVDKLMESVLTELTERLSKLA